MTSEEFICSGIQIGDEVMTTLDLKKVVVVEFYYFRSDGTKIRFKDLSIFKNKEISNYVLKNSSTNDFIIGIVIVSKESNLVDVWCNFIIQKSFQDLLVV